MNVSWSVIFAASMAVYATIAIGSAVRWAGWLSAEADQSLLRVVIRVLYPCLIFSVVSHNDALRQANNLLLPPLAGLGTVALGLVAALLAVALGRRATGLEAGKEARTFATCVAIYNYGFIPIPLVRALFPHDSATLGVLFVENMGAEFAVWTLCVMALSGGLDHAWWRRMFNAPSIAIAVGIAVNFAGLWHYMPPFLTTTIDWLGQASIPMSMLLIGAVIADEVQAGRQPGRAADALKSTAWALLLRLGLLPAAFLLVAWLIPASPELKRVLVIMAAMPSGTFPIVMARHYGGQPRVGIQVVLSTSLVSLVTIPMWISFGLRVLGLAG
jgi:predicted permease